MNIRCDRQELFSAIAGVSRAVAGKSSIAAIEGILLQAEGGRLRLTGYDLEMGIVTDIEAAVESPGDIVINARLFSEMIKKLESDEVLIESDDQHRVRVKGGITEYNFGGIAAEDFPEMPEPSADTMLVIEGKQLKEMIDRTLYAVSQSVQKPVHTGTKFIMEPNKLTLVSVDGYRLAICKKDLLNQSDGSFVVPAKTLSEIAKLIGDKDGEIKIGTARRQGVFWLDGYTVVTRLLEGDFLDYNRAIPQGFETKVTIDVGEFSAAVERAALFVTDNYLSPIRLKFEEGMASITCSTAVGDAFDEMKVNMEGQPVEIGFNNRYILDALRNSGKTELVFELSGPTQPMKVYPTDGDELLFLVLPVRIKAE